MPCNKSKMILSLFWEIIFYQSFFSFQYSLDNEAERQKYELQAERIRQEMNARLGTPNEGVELRIERLTALQRVEAQLNEKRMENLPSVSRAQGHPRSANLEQLYHEAIPMDKALSHSGPSAFGNGLLQHPVSQFILTDFFVILKVC